jgi:cyanate permease
VVLGSGAIAALVMWLAAILGTANLHPSEAAAVQIILVAWAIVCGLATGVLINRRRGRTDEVLFGVTSGAVGGALCGAAYALVLGITYVGTYGGSPVDFTDAAVLTISYPVFAALGALIGTLPGAVLGFSAGLLLQRLPATQLSR